jgi:hypothetical protein
LWVSGCGVDPGRPSARLASPPPLPRGPVPRPLGPISPTGCRWGPPAARTPSPAVPARRPGRRRPRRAVGRPVRPPARVAGPLTRRGHLPREGNRAGASIPLPALAGRPATRLPPAWRRWRGGGSPRWRRPPTSGGRRRPRPPTSRRGAGGRGTRPRGRGRAQTGPGTASPPRGWRTANHRGGSSSSRERLAPGGSDLDEADCPSRPLCPLTPKPRGGKHLGRGGRGRPPPPAPAARRLHRGEGLPLAPRQTCSTGNSSARCGPPSPRHRCHSRPPGQPPATPAPWSCRRHRC